MASPFRSTATLAHSFWFRCRDRSIRPACLRSSGCANRVPRRRRRRGGGVRWWWALLCSWSYDDLAAAAAAGGDKVGGLLRAEAIVKEQVAQLYEKKHGNTAVSWLAARHRLHVEVERSIPNHNDSVSVVLSRFAALRRQSPLLQPRRQAGSTPPNRPQHRPPGTVPDGFNLVGHAHAAGQRLLQAPPRRQDGRRQRLLPRPIRRRRAAHHVRVTGDGRSSASTLRGSGGRRSP